MLTLIITKLQIVVYYAFFLSFKIGQFIVTSVDLVLKSLLSVIGNILVGLSIISEDFLIFLQDVYHGLTSIVYTVYNGLDFIVRESVNVTTIFVDFFYYILTLFDLILNGFLAVIQVVKNSCILIKTIIILFGDGVWFVLAYLPKSFLNTIIDFVDYTKELWGLFYKMMTTNVYNFRQSFFDFFNFLTDVSIETLLGLFTGYCLIYVLLQFYSVIYRYFYNTFVVYYRNTKRLILTIKRKLMNNAIGPIVRNFNLILRNLRIFPIVSAQKRGTTTTTASVVESTKSQDTLCVVCQEETRSILLLNCKHLCLCGKCMDELLRRYRRPPCPICRSTVSNFLQVYL